jgi:hypothetical protein
MIERYERYCDDENHSRYHEEEQLQVMHEETEIPMFWNPYAEMTVPDFEDINPY